MGKIKLKIGDVFTIPISDKKTGIGQIIKMPISSSVFIMTVFKNIYSIQDLPCIEKIVDDEILLLGYSMDSLIYHKKWNIIGNTSTNIDKVKLPYYKIGTPPNISVVNYEGVRIRKATKEEYDNLEHETSFSPIEYVLALKAYYKFGDWEEIFNVLLYENTLKSIEIVEINNNPSKELFEIVRKLFS